MELLFRSLNVILMRPFLPGLNKGERLDCSESYCSHDMLFTGTHLDEQEQVVRFRVENSWGKGSGEGGLYLMTPRWFDE
jgi:bleomycin hydrolase